MPDPTTNADTRGRRTTARPRSIAPAGVVLGLGLGGFVDGILLHQVLQWHHLLSSTGSDRLGLDAQPVGTVHGLEMNTLADGIFHIATWLLVLGGLAMLVARLPEAATRDRRPRVLVGWLLVGWGVFNVVEGVVNHQLLGIHHVRSGPHELAWDLGFLALGALLVVGGWLLQRSAGTPDVRRDQA